MDVPISGWDTASNTGSAADVCACCVSNVSFPDDCHDLFSCWAQGWLLPLCGHWTVQRIHHIQARNDNKEQPGRRMLHHMLHHMQQWYITCDITCSNDTSHVASHATMIHHMLHHMQQWYITCYITCSNDAVLHRGLSTCGCQAKQLQENLSSTNNSWPKYFRLTNANNSLSNANNNLLNASGNDALLHIYRAAADHEGGCGDVVLPGAHQGAVFHWDLCYGGQCTCQDGGLPEPAQAWWQVVQVCWHAFSSTGFHSDNCCAGKASDTLLHTVMWVVLGKFFQYCIVH